MKFTKSATSLIFLIVILGSLISAFYAKKALATEKKNKWGLGGLFSSKKKKAAQKPKSGGLFSGLLNKAKKGITGLGGKIGGGLKGLGGKIGGGLKGLGGKIGGLGKRGLSGLKGLGGKIGGLGKRGFSGLKGLGGKIGGLGKRGFSGLKGLGKKGFSGLKGLGGKIGGLGKRGFSGLKGLGGKIGGGLKGLGAKIGGGLTGFKNSLSKLIHKGKSGKVPKMAPLTPAAEIANAKGKAFCDSNCMINPIAIEKKCLDNGKLIPCKRCTGKPGKDANMKKVCELVCNGNLPMSPCDFYGYVNNKKKDVNVAILSKYGLTIVRRKYRQ